MDVLQLTLWIFGVLITALGIVLGFIANWNHRLSDRVGKVEQGLADFRAEVPFRYANEGDIQRVEKAIEAVRTDFNAAAHELRLGLADVVGKLNQLIGQNTAHRG